ncbi:hypothetical protein ACRAJ3_09720 [Rhodococcus pyridinivorans]|uniref:hypothetical protein n=1 Tax=Rhodococcus pyridinivorans TaxID=103816 RepID=UPI003D7FD989
MKRYRKKPVEIEAMQFTDLDSYLKIVEWWKAQNTGTLTADEVFTFKRPIMLVATLEGTMSANPGDWIIRGVKGEFYPCKPDIFAATYDEVE